MSLASLTLQGHVGTIEAAVERNGRTFRTISVAKQDAETVNGETTYKPTWFKVTTSDRFVLEAMANLKKGDEILAIGTFSAQPWQTRDGHARMDLKVFVASSAGFQITKVKAAKQGAENEPAHEGQD